MQDLWIILTKWPTRAGLSRGTGVGALLFLLCAYMASGITMIKPDEVGVHQRFGAIVNDHVDPGMHVTLPWPVDRVIKVRANRVYRVEVGFRTDPRLVRSPSAMLWETRHYMVPGYEKLDEESVGLSGDEYVVDFSMVVHYRPRDAVVHLLRVNRIQEVIRGLAESVMREVLATVKSAELMTDRKSQILWQMKERMSEAVDRLELGVEILGVYCHDAHPPLITLAKFRDVISAREDRSKFINEAQGQRNEALPRARSDGEWAIADAVAFQGEKKLQAEGDAERFLLASEAYQKAPEVTGYRLFLETLEQSLAKKEKFIANPRANMADYRLWLFTPDASSRQDASGL